jgi:DNA replication and repair protein RecF
LHTPPNPTPSPSPEGEGGISIGTGTLATAPERRIVRVQGATASATALSEWLSAVWLTPAQDRLFAGTPGERRRFLDRLVLAVEPSHAHHSTRYEAAMRQRNRLLAEDRMDEVWLRTLEAAMEEHGMPIQRARLDMVKALMAQRDASTEASFPSFRIMLTNILMDGLATRLAASRKLHAAAGRTLVGPHTQDIEVEYVAKSQPAAQSSTGEQKALLLGIVLAHADLVAAQTGRRPLLLLDEVAAHLDPARRAALFARLHDGGGQVWMTGTEPALFAGVPVGATHFTVADGAIRCCDRAAI